MTVQPFRLSDTAFAALGAGRPSADTLGVLRRAERTRHLLLLRQALRRVSDTPEWYADPPDDPMTGLWAGAAVTRSPHVLTTAGDGLTLSVRLEDTDPVRARLGLTPTPPLSGAEVEHWRDCLERAWAVLVRRHRPAAETMAAVLRVIVPVVPDPSAEGISATSAEAFGAVAMSSPAGPDALAAGLLHETQHSVLNATSLLFDLVEPGGPRGYSPWRDDPRPAFGVLHGAYAYLAVVRFRRAEPGRAAAFEFARWRSAVARAAAGLLAGGELTPAGVRFTTALLAEVEPWLAEPVEPEVQRLADLANADHRVRWRLRNLTVTPEDTARLVTAWRAGAGPPRVTPVLTGTPGRELAGGPRLPLIRALLDGRDPGEGPDADWVRGTVLPAYPIGVWDGLALVSRRPAWRERPEVVRAVARAIPEAGTEAVAIWLSNRN
ncbi:aKG-HExxH-type peptide beta-hydroxylase [Actinoplanes sp. G11-F43]|uniref:aKG-HExxH-type peptide beta-hydroxylase n=1 Tax=Actinoplanes sp. G11-F43 TaxID=3424130 RepID=UPI003D32B4D6